MEARKPLSVIAEPLNKSVNAVYLKCKRLDLKVEEDAKGYTTSSLKLPKELPSIEEALKILAAALEKAGQQSLDKVEIQRLQIVASLARTYKAHAIQSQMCSLYYESRNNVMGKQRSERG
ncbi:MAG: hypothetical protein OEY22_11530 [Candidatus Bathyarchaeota archaeon]|nr:hypothetical protein [Candidatus Bathyarchaeota archaeon]MDH5788019.1 hypothetical protein [Candidatus Bathyarchaeota archaeon]